MNMKLFFTIFFGIVAAGVCLYFFIRWRQKEDEAHSAKLESKLPRKEIGFAAIRANQQPA